MNSDYTTHYPRTHTVFQLQLLLILSLVACLTWSEEDRAYQLFKAAENGDMTTVERLISEGVDVNASNKSGSYALNAAAFKNNHQMIQLLLEHGAVVDSRNMELDTPLICATKYSSGDKKTIQMLLDAGADLQAVDKNGNTALFYARDKGQTEAVSVLSTTK